MCTGLTPRVQLICFVCRLNCSCWPRRYSFECKRIGEAIFTKPTIDIFGRPLAIVPATRLLALASNALEPAQVVEHAAYLRTQLEHALEAEDPGEEERQRIRDSAVVP